MGALADTFGGKTEGELIRATDWNGMLTAIENLVAGVQQTIEAELAPLQTTVSGLETRLSAAEAQIADLSDEDKSVFLDYLGMAEPGLNRVIRAAYALLGLQTYFTAGPKEVRAWTVQAGATAPQAAGVIHTDFERGFIRAEVAAYDDFVAHGGELGAKEAGKLRLEGRDYTVRDGDVIHFRFNV